MKNETTNTARYWASCPAMATEMLPLRAKTLVAAKKAATMWAGAVAALDIYEQDEQGKDILVTRRAAHGTWRDLLY